MMNLVLNETTKFFYWLVYIEAGDYDIRTVAPFRDYYSHPIFKEFLCTSIEPPIENLIGGLPVYKSFLVEPEKLRIQRYKSISVGEVHLVKDVNFYFGSRFLPDFSPAFVNEWINFFIDNVDDIDR